MCNNFDLYLINFLLMALMVHADSLLKKLVRFSNEKSFELSTTQIED